MLLAANAAPCVTYKSDVINRLAIYIFEKTPNLEFGAERALALAEAKPLNRVLRALEAHLPDFFVPVDPRSGVQSGTVHFAQGTIEGLSDDHHLYLHARAAGAMPKLADVDRLSIVSGVCLFGESGIRSYGADDTPTELERPNIAVKGIARLVTRVEKGQSQLYVPESAARLGRTMVALAQYAERHDKSTEMFVHVPGPEYKVHAEALYAKGRLTLEALQQYHDVIDEESSDIRSRFSEMFEKFGLEAPMFGSPIESIVEGFEVGSLASNYQTVADRLPSMLDLLHISYAIAYHTANKPGNLPVFVDNHSEQGIFELAKQLKGFKGLALYPLADCASTRVHDLFDHASANQAEIDLAVAAWC